MSLIRSRRKEQENKRTQLILRKQTQNKSVEETTEQAEGEAKAKKKLQRELKN
jgi:hypothetical protein